MARIRTPGDGPKCVICGKPAVWSGYCKMEDGKGYCDSAPRHDPVGEAKYVLGGTWSDTTPAEIIADVLEERGRLYWEQVGKIADSAVDEWKRINPDNLPYAEWVKVPGSDPEAIISFVEKACKSLAVVAYKDPFEAFVVLHHSKHPSAVLNTKVGPSTKRIIKEKFPATGPFPWTMLALNAFFNDCGDTVNERLKVLPKS